MTRVVVATGTLREGAVLRGEGWTIVAGGGDAEGLAAQLAAAADGAAGILSFGMAGALSPERAIGDWVVADRVTGGFAASCDPTWRDQLAARLPGARIGAVHADGRMAASVAEKAALGAGGALAVDMESHVAARVAAEGSLPLAVARCISDVSTRALPPAIVVAMRPGGRLALGAVVRSLVERPAQLSELAVTLAGFARAMRSLRHGASRLGR